MSNDEKHSHHILSDTVSFRVLVLLLIMTVVTVAIARVDLGILNFFIAMLVASVKAALVFLFFMGLKYDNNENRVIFGCSVVFVAIFVVLTASDLFFRPEGSRHGGNLNLPKPQGGEEKLVKPWVSTPELLARGKKAYDIQCTSCHGVGGAGDGPAAAALNPAPRDFTTGSGWTKGRKPSAVFSVVTDGLEGTSMASFGTLPAGDRWGLVHYVLSMGPEAQKDTVADLKAIGYDPSKEGGGGPKKKASIPVDLALELMATDGHQ